MWIIKHSITKSERNLKKLGYYKLGYYINIFWNAIFSKAWSFLAKTLCLCHQFWGCDLVPPPRILQSLVLSKSPYTQNYLQRFKQGFITRSTVFRIRYLLSPGNIFSFLQPLFQWIWQLVGRHTLMRQFPICKCHRCLLFAICHTLKKWHSKRLREYAHPNACTQKLPQEYVANTFR